MDIKIKRHPKFEGIYVATLEDGSYKLATKNLIQGIRVYGERLIRLNSIEYRIWDPFRSKLAAAVLKKVEMLPIKLNHKILYLGAATGTTVSHISDIVGERGFIYCIEFASRSMRELIDNVSVFRRNISPIFADARSPKDYLSLVEKVDGIYCDIAQPEQAKILANNADIFLKSEGWAMLAVKARSIDVTKNPIEIFRLETNILKKRGFKISSIVNLTPFDKDHVMIVASYV